MTPVCVGLWVLCDVRNTSLEWTECSICSGMMCPAVDMMREVWNERMCPVWRRITNQCRIKYEVYPTHDHLHCSLWVVWKWIPLVNTSPKLAWLLWSILFQDHYPTVSLYQLITGICCFEGLHWSIHIHPHLARNCISSTMFPELISFSLPLAS